MLESLDFFLKGWNNIFEYFRLHNWWVLDEDSTVLYCILALGLFSTLLVSSSLLSSPFTSRVEKKSFERLKKYFQKNYSLHYWWVLDLLYSKLLYCTLICSALLCYRLLCSPLSPPPLSSPLISKVLKGWKKIFFLNKSLHHWWVLHEDSTLLDCTLLYYALLSSTLF